ncbi:hypothetical protein BGZ60DRAFT_391600 [Tricladium varicosporioides]|nr:hypothetical protein BGZ60DRAFT_391600 [Hymenoscyphus varicosporioides]
MSVPIVSFANSLEFSVTVYDSFSNQDKTNYFGTLTSLATVLAKTTASVQLIHPTSALIVSNATTNVPLARRIYSPALSTGPLSVAQADVDAMTQTMNFITFITSNQNDPLALAFKALWKDTSKPQVTPANKFFAQHPTYAKCTFATYMMGITYMAELPVSKGKPLDQALYSLSTVVTLLGGTWPSDFPDIVVTKFTCDTKNDVLAIRAEIDLKKLPAQSDQALQFFGSLFGVQKLQVAFTFNYGFNLGVLGTRLSISLDTMKVPFGGSSTLAINKPTATIDINPLFKFVVFTVTGSIPFNAFGKAFEADVSMVIDNLEANFGVVIKGDHSSLPAPPVMQGVHFDEFGLGIGIFFEPPGAAIGLSGKLHIGELASGTQQALADDTFVVVCQLIEEVPNPLYVSFYVPQMHLTDVLTVFTNAKSSLDVPVSFTDLSFQWSENPMAPVALPDGSLSNMGYGFNATANILSFSFHGDVEIDLTNGLKADIEMAPLSLGSVFSLGGDGSGVSIKADASGNPIKNNLLATTAARQKALKDATTKQLVPPGGPVLRLQTFASPFLRLDAFVSLFEVENLHLAADITSSGIQFKVGFGSLLTTNMSCTLADFHNLAASFQFGINQNISLPTIAGVSLGSILVEALANTHFSLNTSSSDLILTVGGSFDFEGLTRNFGDFTADVHIQKVSDLLSAIVTYIEQHAEELFKDLLNTGAMWAGKVKDGVITAADSVASVLHNAFEQDARQVASTMRDVGFSVDAVADALKDAFGLSIRSVTEAMQRVGYTGQEVAGALKTAFGDEAQQIASALSGVYGWSADQVQGVLSGLGFTANQIGQAFQSLGGDFAKAGQAILDALNPSNLGKEIEHDLDPRNWFG